MKNTFILVILLWIETLVAGTSLWAASCHTAVDEKPFIFNFTESAAPGETVGLQGSSFGASPEIWYTVLKGKNPSVKPQTKLNILTASDMYVAFQIPEKDPVGLYAVWIKNNGRLSDPVFINRADIRMAEFDEVMPGTSLRLFGRNMMLTGYTPAARFVDEEGNSFSAGLKGLDEYTASLVVPQQLKSGKKYSLYISNGAGGENGESLFDESLMIRQSGNDPLNLGVPWGADFDFSENIYNVKNDSRLKLKAAGDGVSNDREAIQAAIDLAAANGGGIVYLPAGRYKIVYTSGSGITMQSRVVLKGEGREKTLLKYGYGKPFSTERVKGRYGWTLGWPDCRTEGMGLLFPGLISRSGLSDLSLINVNESGSFLHTVKNMPEGGEKIFIRNCSMDFSSGWGLALVSIDKLLVTGSQFKSTTVDVRGINAPTRTWPWDFKNSCQLIIRGNQYQYNAGRFGANGCHHALFEDNHFLRNGNYQSKGETGGLNMDYVTDMIVLNNSFQVTGSPIEARNQGETILSQGGDPNQMTSGMVYEATATTVTDRKQEWQDFTDRISTAWQYAVHPTNYMIAIVSGKGAGQWRTIVHNNDTVLSLDRPWDVIPEKGSHYIINQWSAYQLLVKGNILKDNHQGIMMYCGGADIDIVGNELINSSGIYLRADQRLSKKRYNLLWNTYVADNICADEDGRRAAFVSLLLSVEKDQELFGVGALGLTVRRNTVKAFMPNVTHSPVKAEGFLNYLGDQAADNLRIHPESPGILGTVFEDNTAINTDNAFILGKGAHHTVILNNKTERIANPVKNQLGEKQQAGARYTITDIQ